MVRYSYDGLSRRTGDDETGVAYSYDALGRKVTRDETMWAEHQPQGNAWGLQKDPGEKAAPATEGKESTTDAKPAADKGNDKGNDKASGKGGQAAARTESATAAAEEPITCPEGTVPMEVHGNSDKAEKPGKDVKPLRQVTETTRYLYDGLTSVVANEYGQNGQDVAQYYRSQRDIVARKQFGLKGLINPGQETTLPMAGGLKYYHPDLRGSVSALTDPKGQMVEQYRYDAFGGLFTGITAPYNTSGLNGHEFDPASGLMDMKARWYAPQNGRFLTPDAWRGTVDEPWTQNKYAYAGNNPVTRWDPTGHFSCSLGSDCIEDSTWYFFEGSRPGPSSSRMVDSWVDLEGTYRSYDESSTTYYDYHVIYITWVNRELGQATWTEGNRTFSERSESSYTTFQPHTQDSLNEYTEDYREVRTGPMPAEREISRKVTSVTQSEWSSEEGAWVDLVRPNGGKESAGSQVVDQAVAKATGGVQYVVQPGDTLSVIASNLYGNGASWQEIAGMNPQLENPNTIYAGQVLNLPGRPTALYNVSGPAAVGGFVPNRGLREEADFVPQDSTNAPRIGMGDLRYSDVLSGNPSPTPEWAARRSERQALAGEPHTASSGGWGVPLDGTVSITAHWAWAPDYIGIYHKGIDFDSDVKAPEVRAVTGGEVVFAGLDPRNDDGCTYKGEPLPCGYGNVVVQKTDDGAYVVYAHMKDKPNVGNRVSTNDPLGKMGSTGYALGNHLHLEVWTTLDESKVKSGNNTKWNDVFPYSDGVKKPDILPGNVDPIPYFDPALGYK